MAVNEHPMQALAAYLPNNCFDDVVAYIHYYKVHLTVTRSRKTILGDYRHSFQNKNHRITVNGNLNKYEFLITLLHELAHLLTYEQFGNRVDAHGREWKSHYGKLLLHFLQKQIFPYDIVAALHKTINNPAATANGETELLTILRKYNTVKKEGFVLLSALPIGSLFETEKGRIFKKIQLRRKRFECVEMKTQRHFSFSPIAEVKAITTFIP